MDAKKINDVFKNSACSSIEEDDGSNASEIESSSSNFSLDTQPCSAEDSDAICDKPKDAEASAEFVLATQPSSQSDEDCAFNHDSRKSPEQAHCAVSQSSRVFNVEHAETSSSEQTAKSSPIAGGDLSGTYGKSRVDLETLQITKLGKNRGKPLHGLSVEVDGEVAIIKSSNSLEKINAASQNFSRMVQENKHDFETIKLIMKGSSLPHLTRVCGHQLAGLRVKLEKSFVVHNGCKRNGNQIYRLDAKIDGKVEHVTQSISLDSVSKAQQMLHEIADENKLDFRNIVDQIRSNFASR